MTLERWLQKSIFPPPFKLREIQSLSTNKAKELKVGLLWFTVSLTLDVKPTIKLQMAEKWDCLAPARFRMVLALQSLLLLLVSFCQLKVLALTFKAVKGPGLFYREHCALIYEHLRKTQRSKQYSPKQKAQNLQTMHSKLKIANHNANFCSRLDKTQVLSHLDRLQTFRTG